MHRAKRPVQLTRRCCCGPARSSSVPSTRPLQNCRRRFNTAPQSPPRQARTHTYGSCSLQLMRRRTQVMTVREQRQAPPASNRTPASRALRCTDDIPCQRSPGSEFAHHPSRRPDKTTQPARATCTATNRHHHRSDRPPAERFGARPPCPGFAWRLAQPLRHPYCEHGAGLATLTLSSAQHCTCRLLRRRCQWLHAPCGDDL